MRRTDKVVDEHDGEQSKEENNRPGRFGWNAAEPRSSADIFRVQQNNADNLPKAQRRDGQIVAIQTEGRHPDQYAAHCRYKSAQQNCRNKRHIVIKRQNRRSIGAYRHESRMTDRELSRNAVD
ncbi:hypothetical protein D3C73_1224990 [compost metagenome]